MRVEKRGGGQRTKPELAGGVASGGWLVFLLFVPVGLAWSLRGNGCLSCQLSGAGRAAWGHVGGVDRLTMLDPVTHGCIVFFGVSNYPAVE